MKKVAIRVLSAFFIMIGVVTIVPLYAFSFVLGCLGWSARAGWLRGFAFMVDADRISEPEKFRLETRAATPQTRF